MNDGMNNEKILIHVKRSKRRTISVTVGYYGDVLVHAPLNASREDISKFLNREKEWILKRVEKHRQHERQSLLTEEEIARLQEQALYDFSQRTRRIAEQIGVTYGKITIRGQRSKYGSCTAKGNLNYNYILMLAPEEVREYVVLHELTHRKHMDHSRAFWYDVETAMPDYKQWDGWLKENGAGLIERIPRK